MLMRHGEAASRLIDQWTVLQRAKATAEETLARHRQMARHRTAVDRRLPSPLAVLRLVVAKEAALGQRRGAAAAVAAALRKERSTISQQLRVAEDCRARLIRIRDEVLPIAVKMRGDRDRKAAKLRANIDAYLRTMEALTIPRPVQRLNLGNAFQRAQRRP